MATQTPNFNLNLRESADIFNPLSTNANFESLDTILKNLQEADITTYTTVVSDNTLRLSGTPNVNEVFKFVAADDATDWIGAGGGRVLRIKDLTYTGTSVTKGNLYLAWMDINRNMVLLNRWPSNVDAQKLGGKPASSFPTTEQLDAVKTTADNAVTTAQAAATVADNALQAAQTAGIKMTLLWENPDVTSGANRNTGTAFASPIPTNTKFFAAVFRAIANIDRTLTVTGMNIGETVELNAWSDTDDGQNGIGRGLFIRVASNTYGWGFGYSYNSGSSSENYCVPYRIYAIEF